MPPLHNFAAGFLQEGLQQACQCRHIAKTLPKDCPQQQWEDLCQIDLWQGPRPQLNELRKDLEQVGVKFLRIVSQGLTAQCVSWLSKPCIHGPVYCALCNTKEELPCRSRAHTHTSHRGTSRMTLIQELPLVWVTYHVMLQMCCVQLPSCLCQLTFTAHAVCIYSIKYIIVVDLHPGQPSLMSSNLNRANYCLNWYGRDNAFVASLRQHGDLTSAPGHPPVR